MPRLYVQILVHQEYKRPAHRPLDKVCEPLGMSYFGGGVVVVLLPFLLFLPPLWPFLPPLVLVLDLDSRLDVAPGFLPVVSLPVLDESVLPPPAWANPRLTASNMVNTTVKSFFMQSPF